MEDSPKAGNGAITRDLAEITRDAWEYRELLHHLALRDIKLRYKQAAMGFGWALFMPLFIVAAGIIIRIALAHVSGNVLQRTEVAGLLVKALPWSFFIGSIGLATVSLTTNANLVSKIYFPREVLTLAVVMAQGLDFLIGAVVIVVALPFFGATLSLQLLWVFPLLLLLLLFTAGVSLFLACANLFFRDVKYIVQVLLTFGIFFTPVIFEPAMLGGRGARLLMWNPMSPILEGFRLSLVQGHNLLEPLTVTAARGGTIVAWDPWYLAYAAVASLVALLGSAVLFHRSEFAFAEYV